MTLVFNFQPLPLGLRSLIPCGLGSFVGSEDLAWCIQRTHDLHRIFIPAPSDIAIPKLAARFSPGWGSTFVEHLEQLCADEESPEFWQQMKRFFGLDDDIGARIEDHFVSLYTTTADYDDLIRYRENTR